MFNQNQDFGPRDLAISPYHNGLDFSGYSPSSDGEVISAIAAGSVIAKQVDADKSTSLGNFIHVQHDGYQSRYCHMQAGSHAHLTVGSYIGQGIRVGNIGNTGTATTGAHLHLDVYENGTRIDPQAFIRAHLDDPATDLPRTNRGKKMQIVLHTNHNPDGSIDQLHYLVSETEVLDLAGAGASEIATYTAVWGPVIKVDDGRMQFIINAVATNKARTFA